MRKARTETPVAASEPTGAHAAVEPKRSGIDHRVPLRDPLLLTILGTALGMGVLHVILIIGYGASPVLFETPWYIPMTQSFVALAAFCVAFLALGRYRVLRDPTAYWIGIGLAAFGILCIFFMLTWPGLLPNGQALIARLPGTSGWMAFFELTDASFCLLAAVLIRWPGENHLRGARWAWSLVAWLAFVTLAATLAVAFEQSLPVLVAANGHFSVLLLSADWVFMLLLALGAVLSTRHYWLTGDALTGYVALAQISLAFVVFTALVGGKRYDIWYYLSRVELVGGFLILMFGLLSAYVGLFRRERDKTRDLETANEYLEESLGHAQSARIEVEAKNRELEGMVYSVAHDLRAPLVQISELSRTLLTDFGAQLPADSRPLVGIIRDHAAATNCLAEDLLTLSTVTHNSLSKRAIPMVQLVHEVLTELLASEDGRQVDTHLGDLPDAQGDARLFRQVWVHLIGNSLKFTRPREQTRLEIGSLRTGEGTVYFVKDNGVGFDMHQASRLFRPFQRLHHPDEFEGNGLGLAIVQRIIERHGGRAWAESAVGQGATFYFSLDAAPGAVEPTTTAPRHTALTSDYHREQRMIRVLVVDDHQLFRQGLKVMLLKAKDLQIVGEAQDGQEAIDLAERLQPDVILMDIEMPRLNGLDATQTLVAKGHKARIVMLTMHTEERDVRAAAKMGAHGFLIKNSSRDELIDAIRSVHQGKQVVSSSVASFFSDTIS